MKIIVPFEKEIMFKSNVSEITSISLEHQLAINELLVNGNFIINGEYKVSDVSNTVEKLDLKLPVSINIDEKYNTSKASVDIDDFYYEVINNSVLKVCIDVVIDSLEIEKKEEIPDMDRKIDIIDEVKDKVIDIKDSITDKVGKVTEKIGEVVSSVTETASDTKDQVKDKINTLFSNMDSSDIYISYNIYIIREGDTLDTILDKYNITDEELRKYNNLTDLKIGDKIIIPNC